MHALTGNMGRVYRGWERMDIARNAERTMAGIDRRTGVIEAELSGFDRADWFVVLPYAGCEPVAARHLVRRRFGIYQPVLDRVVHTRRATVHRKEPMFPGYLFIFIWDVKKHYARVRACPGIAGFLMDNQRPAIMPDAFISRMQVMECVSEGLGRTSKRFRRRYRKETITGDPDPCEVVITTRSHWDHIDKLEAPERISLLHKALGLPS